MIKYGFPQCLAVLAFGLVLSVLQAPASARPGDLDLSFGIGGKVTSDIEGAFGSGESVALQTDGKIVVSGHSTKDYNDDFAVIRYNSDGSLDTTFGGVGRVVTDLGSSSQEVGQCVAVQGDGKIVVAGYSGSSFNGDYAFAIVRYNPDGSLDAGFGDGGKVITIIANHSSGHGLALQEDGKIVVAGEAFNGSDYDFAVARYNPDGSLDTGFGSGGKVITGFSSGADYGNSVAVQDDGKILVAGSSYGAFAVARYNLDGSLDADFGTGGKVTSGNRFDYAVGHSVALQSDGKIVVAGYSNDDGDAAFEVMRFNGDGSVDTGFGNGGNVAESLGNGYDYAHSVKIQGDGKIVVAGVSSASGNSAFALIRLNVDGTRDADFGSGGIVITKMSSSPDYARSVVLQSDGKIVVAGDSAMDSIDFAVARYEIGPLKPKVTTETATDITTTSARLSGTVNPNGVSTDVSFGVWESGFPYAPADLAPAEQSPLSGSATQSVSVVKTGLKPHTTYRFNIAASSLGGNNGGADVTFTTANSKPVANNDSFHRRVLDLRELAVAANDTDEDKDSFTIVAVTHGAKGTVTTDGRTVAYTRGDSYDGSDTFTYTLSDGFDTAIGTVTLANSKPVANSDTFHRREWDLRELAVAANDTDADEDWLFIVAVTQGAKGTVTTEGWKVYYAPGDSFDGNDTFTYTLSDDCGGHSIGVITIVNSAPVANPDHITTNDPVTVAVLANDTDVDSDWLRVSRIVAATNGTAVLTEGGSGIAFTPAVGFHGQASVTYEVVDDHGGRSNGVLLIDVPLRDPLREKFVESSGEVPGSGVEGSGIPEGSKWRTFGAPAINDAGQVAFLGNWTSPAGSGAGIFVDERLVVKAGDSVPGLSSSTFRSFTDPQLNGTGRVAFLATITGPGVNKGNDTVLVTDAFTGTLEVVAREGDETPETGGAKLRKFYGVSLRGKAEEDAGLLFTASLQPGRKPLVNASNDFGAWLRTPSLGDSPRKVVREGDPIFGDGKKIKSFKLLVATSGSPAQGRGHHAADKVSFPVTLSNRQQVLVRFSGGMLNPELTGGSTVGQSITEASWKSFGQPVTNASGTKTAVYTTLERRLLGQSPRPLGTHIFMNIGLGGAYARVVGVGDHASGIPNARFTALTEPLIAGSVPNMAFIGTVKGNGVRADNNAGIWWQIFANERRLVAREGDQATETLEGTRWKSFVSLALPEGNTGPVFLATLMPQKGVVNTSNDTGVWGVDSKGELRLLVREGGGVGTKGIRSFSTLKAASGSPGVTRSFNNQGQLVYLAYFFDGTQGIVTVEAP